MKYLVLVCDGMGDYPIAQLHGKTPLEVAKTPAMDALAAGGRVGLARTIPAGFTPASDVGNLAILGYDPHRYYCGRGPLEAANMGVELRPGDVAFRCNLVTGDGDTLVDYSAGHIGSAEAETLIKAVDAALGNDRVRFYPGIQYRHLMVVRDPALADDLVKTQCFPPHDIMGWKISEHRPHGPAAALLNDLMDRARAVLLQHEVNHVRIDLKENPGNLIWLWGQGQRLAMPTFHDRFGVTGAIISAVDLIKGIGRLTALEVLSGSGWTGYYDTNYVGKADAALKALKERDFVFVHVEAADEAGHNGHLREKVAAIENFDKLIVAPLVEAFARSKQYRILVIPDHLTSVEKRTHVPDPVPFLVYGRGIEPNGVTTYSESSAKAGGWFVESAHDLLPKLLTADTW
ncbi:MAG: cofactor-independent phosphoglycerate mutase [Candidatus Omnitrophica bacterium]|nr:cofactor-independent phosphoglycerate mutase [Candidatus Omnitrophota bacterium]